MTLAEARAALESLTSETKFWMLTIGAPGLRRAAEEIAPNRVRLGGFELDLGECRWALQLQNGFGNAARATGRFVRTPDGWDAVLDVWQEAEHR